MHPCITKARPKLDFYQLLTIEKEPSLILVKLFSFDIICPNPHAIQFMLHQGMPDHSLRTNDLLEKETELSIVFSMVWLVVGVLILLFAT